MFVHRLLLYWLLTALFLECVVNAIRTGKRDLSGINYPQCEPIRIEMCRGIGYNETSMPNLVGHELQNEVELTLETFTPLIKYMCSSQLKLFLCAAYVPMCTPEAPVPIGPCRSLCESVRTLCNPVLQGFGFPWPPALDCNHFPKHNNQKTMCMEGPGEAHMPAQDNNDFYMGMPVPKMPTYEPNFECPGLGKTDVYRKLYRSGRCAQLCNADVLFGQNEKHMAEMWVTTWTYAALGLAVITTMCLCLSDDTKMSAKWLPMLTPLFWCHNMVTVGWSVRFIIGRIASACGFDPQLPNVSLLLVDGLSNASCAATFLLRYYFGMAACAWWAILCLGWHREVRRNSPDLHGNIALNPVPSTGLHGNKTHRNGKRSHEFNVTHSNLARFIAWGLPGFQTAAVLVAGLADADELLGACFVGNQSDKGLQILVATPLFCYWIFGSMNLISGYLVHRRSKEFMENTNSPGLLHALQAKNNNSGIGTFLFIYCVPCTLQLVAIIYEFANIDVWLNVSTYMRANGGFTTPMWPFMTRAFMELMLGIICFAWILGPKISTIYKRQMTPRPPIKTSTVTVPQHMSPPHMLIRGGNIAYSTASYQSVRHPPASRSHHHSSGGISMNQMSNYSIGRQKHHHTAAQLYANNHKSYKPMNHFGPYGNETIL